MQEADSQPLLFSQEAIDNLIVVCQVSRVRAQQLLEAASGSMERAVDIHVSSCSGGESVFLAQPPIQEDAATKSPVMNERKRPAAAPAGSASPSKATKSTPTKQRKLHSFFTSTSSASPKVIAASSQPAKLSSISLPNERTASTSCAKVPITSDTIDLEADPTTATHANIKEQEQSGGGRIPAVAATKSTNNDPRLEFANLTQTFTVMCETTKRTIKLNALKDLFVQVIQAVGGIHETSLRTAHARVLECTIDLVLGKIGAEPLQVSGSAVSTAIQTITGINRNKMREGYRKTGDMGDVAASHFVASPMRHFVVQKPNKATGGSAGRRTILQVHDMLRSIATVQQGKGSQANRQNLLLKCLRGCQEKDELRFLVRILLGNMRLGATIKTVLAGLAMAVEELQIRHGADVKEPAYTGTKRDDVTQTLQQIFYICPRIDEIAHALLCGGIACAQAQCSLAVGFPIHPMLANPAHSLKQVEKFVTNDDGEAFEAVAEWKYDGMRLQAHWDGEQTTLFSRHLLDTTEQYSDAVEYLLQSVVPGVSSFIIDAEIVGVAQVEGESNQFRLLPFQDLASRRGAKQSQAIQIRIFAFDLLYLNGESLLNRPLHERQATLRRHFKETAGFALAASITLPRYDETVIQNFLKEAVQGGAEGLMIKLTGKAEQQDSKKVATRSFGYESGTRGQLWLKLKRDYVSTFADTIDVVPIGAWYGSGRKAEKGYLSPVLFAVYDEDEGVFRSVSRCMSFSDKMYEAMREFYFRGTPYPDGVGIDAAEQPIEATIEGMATSKENASLEAVSEGSDHEGELQAEEDAGGAVDQRVNCFPGRPSSAYVVTNESPTVWFKPSEVFEVSFADLSLSRVHTAGAGLVDDPEGRGIALRFPRFKRRRPDKSIEQATTTAQMAQLFYQQSKVYKG